MIADLQDEIITESWNTASDIDNTGYTSRRFTPDKLLTVSYYDNYSFISLTDNSLNYDAGKENEYGYKHASAKGLLTGTRTYLLDGSNNYTATAQYYDYKGQMIQSRSSNHLGGHDYEYIQYNFKGNVTKTLKEHNIDGQSTVTELYEYDYDHALRPTTVNYTLNSNDRVLLASNKYDELGRLVEKKRHSNADTEQFEYNIRGWATKIKSGDFEQNLYYNTAFPNTTPCYNGNISRSTWKYNGTTHGYSYWYDALNRITGAVQNLDNDYTEYFTYDKQGNITVLERYGNSYSELDNMELTYNGNQLKRVYDDEGSKNLYNTKEYNDRANEETEFLYDSNGNLTTDLDRDIVTIKYNLLNLPDIIQFRNGNQIINTYDASGRKLKSQYCSPISSILGPITASVGEVLDFSIYPDYYIEKDVISHVNNFEYKLMEPHYYNYLILGRIHNAEGYTEDNKYFYYRKDHLGNNREVWQASYTSGSTTYPAATVQRTQYYPSGLPWKSNSGDNPGSQPYKYGGKEFVEMHGLDEYDSVARWYYPAIMRTTTPDPLAEKYYDISPYAWCGNNPVRFVDPDGKKIVIAGTKEYRTQVKNDIKQLAKDNPEVKKMIVDLIKSSNIHTIEMPKENDGYNYVQFDEKKAEDGIAQGSKVGYDPNKRDTKGEKERTPRVGLAHELKHSSDIDKGEMDMETKTETGVPVKEIDAINTENKIRERTGDEKRTTYGGKKISELWLNN